jgi:hypothetical protein
MWGGICEDLRLHTFVESLAPGPDVSAEGVTQKRLVLFDLRVKSFRKFLEPVRIEEVHEAVTLDPKLEIVG